MNCSTCRYELSQCLDGRLPSGRRATVLRHAESCKGCGAFWKELQSAQQLTLSLRTTEVSSDFRDGLWERIQTGEGTPQAVFQETVSVGTKMRYALTGAAAAAVLLVGATFLRGDSGLLPGNRGTEPTAATVAGIDPNLSATADGRGNSNLQPRSYGNSSHGRGTTGPVAANTLAANSMPASFPPASFPSGSFLPTKQLTFQVLALETAHQLEDRYAQAANGMRMLRDPQHDREMATARVMRSANEMRDFGELLLELHDTERVSFRDQRLYGDLRFAVKMLDQARRLSTRSGHTTESVESFVEPALRQRLANISDTIMVAAARNPREDLDDLMRINLTRPEVFPKLFIVLGNQAELIDELKLMSPGEAFLVEDVCGPSWVAPRSEVDRRAMMMHRFRTGGAGEMHGEMSIRIEIGKD